MRTSQEKWVNLCFWDARRQRQKGVVFIASDNELRMKSQIDDERAGFVSISYSVRSTRCCQHCGWTHQTCHVGLRAISAHRSWQQQTCCATRESARPLRERHVASYQNLMPWTTRITWDGGAVVQVHHGRYSDTMALSMHIVNAIGGRKVKERDTHMVTNAESWWPHEKNKRSIAAERLHNQMCRKCTTSCVTLWHERQQKKL